MTTFVAGVGGSSAVGPTSGGKVYAYNNLTTTPKVVVPANQNRTGLTFYNPGPVNVYISPVFVQAIDTAPTNGAGSNVTLNPGINSLGGCCIVYANGGSMTFQGECQGAYQAFSASGFNNPFTVMDTNV